MTPAQQAALEGVVGRVLTPGEVEQLDQLLDPDNRNDVQIAEILSADRFAYRDTRKVAIGIIGAYPLGPIAADEVLGKLEAHAAADLPLARLVGRALKALDAEPGLNLGDPATQAMLDALVPGVITADEAAALKSISRSADPVDVSDVSRALNLAEGRMHMGA